MVNKKHVSDKVQSLLSQCAKVKGPLRPPIDPVNLADLCGVLGIERRPMVPEGVLTPVQGGFRIFLQSNFDHRPGVMLRQRFTIAHELVHTFYYDVSGGIPERKKGAPKGQTLERLCHIGASQILVPGELLRREVKTKGKEASAEFILDLAGMFSVSAEVMVRRLHELELFAGDNFAAILVDIVDGGRGLIQAACYAPFLLCLAAQPKRGLDFDSWVRPLLAPSGGSQDSGWTRTTPLATIAAKKVFRSNRSFILDLRFIR
jgi:hypothetical protein